MIRMVTGMDRGVALFNCSPRTISLAGNTCMILGKLACRQRLSAYFMREDGIAFFHKRGPDQNSFFSFVINVCSGHGLIYM